MFNKIPNACSTMRLLRPFLPFASISTSTNLLISPLYTKLARQSGLFETDILSYGEEFTDSGVTGESQND
jgi:hypothetical protein